MEAVDMETVKRVWKRVRQGLPEQKETKPHPKRQGPQPGCCLEQMLLVALCLKCIKR